MVNLPAVQETWVRSLSREDCLDKEMATHSRILTWKNPMDRGSWLAMHSMGVAKESDTTAKQQNFCRY